MATEYPGKTLTMLRPFMKPKVYKRAVELTSGIEGELLQKGWDIRPTPEQLLPQDQHIVDVELHARGVTKAVAEYDQEQIEKSAAEFVQMRTVLELSQQELADALGVTRETVSNWERAVHAIPYSVYVVVSGMVDKKGS